MIIAQKAITIKGPITDLTDAQMETICDTLDSIDFESIIKQKLEEKGITNVQVFSN